MSEEMNNWPDHFRYIDEIGPNGLTVSCRRYVVVRESEHCYWICWPDAESVALQSIRIGKIPKYVRVFSSNQGDVSLIPISAMR